MYDVENSILQPHQVLCCSTTNERGEITAPPPKGDGGGGSTTPKKGCTNSPTLPSPSPLLLLCVCVHSKCMVWMYYICRKGRRGAPPPGRRRRGATQPRRTRGRREHHTQGVRRDAAPAHRRRGGNVKWWYPLPPFRWCFFRSSLCFWAVLLWVVLLSLLLFLGGAAFVPSLVRCCPSPFFCFAEKEETKSIYRMFSKVFGKVK